MSTISLQVARERWADEVERRVLASVGDDGLLAAMGRYHVSTGGKRLRALLPVWACANLGGDPAAALDLGAGLELIHNATLVHDDLQDGDATRRGRPTVWHRWGAAQAINSGAALYFQGIGRLCRAPAGPAIAADIAGFVTEVIAGQTMEFQLQLPATEPDAIAPTIASWERMARGKTGGLMAACLFAGGAAAGVEPAERQRLAAFGADLGLLFQLQDDYLDLVGDKGREQRAMDLAEGKRSFPVVWQFEHAPAAAVESLDAILKRPREQTTAAHIAEGLALLARGGAIEATAARLRALAAACESEPLAACVPGLVARFLQPVAHAL